MDTLDLTTAPRGSRRFASSAFERIAVRRAVYLSNGQRLLRAIAVASGIAVVVLFLLALLRPLHEKVVVKIRLPEPTRTLVVPIEPARPPMEREQVAMTTTPDPAVATPEPVAPPSRRAPEPLDPSVGKAGRARAERATAELERATRALDRSLAGLGSSIESATRSGSGPALGRRGAPGAGRTDAQLAAVGDGAASRGVPELRGSSIRGSQVAIGAPVVPAGDGGSPGAARGPSGARSNAALLAVIQRYAAGIQYCYTNELKRDPALRGKLVVALTVAASGAVTHARVAQNTVGSNSLEACALEQIREWRFPAIPSGETSFQVPFVFTPPR